MRHVSLGLLGFAATALTLCASVPTRAADMVISTGKLLVLPFNSINQAEYQPWLGRSIQQSVVADLLASAPGRVISSQTPAADDAAALETARKAGAQYVIRGEFASVGGDVRITGEVLDVATGKPITAIKATGPSSGVFAMEDDLTAQIRRRLALTPPAAEGQAPATTVPPLNGIGVQAPPQPVDPYAQTYIAPVEGNNAAPQIDYNYYYSDQNSDDDGLVPTWPWLWPGWGYSGVVYVAPDYHYHHHWTHFKTSSNNRWNHSYAYGTANSVDGVPIGTGVSTLHAPGMRSIAGGGTRSAVGNTRGAGPAVIARTSTPPPAHIAPAHGPVLHMSTGFSFHGGPAAAHR